MNINDYFEIEMLNHLTVPPERGSGGHMAKNAWSKKKLIKTNVCLWDKMHIWMLKRSSQ